MHVEEIIHSMNQPKSILDPLLTTVTPMLAVYWLQISIHGYTLNYMYMM